MQRALLGVGYLKALGGKSRLRDDLYLLTDGNTHSFRGEQHVFGCNYDQLQVGHQGFSTWKFVPDAEGEVNCFRIQSFEDPNARRWYLREETDGYWDYVHCLSEEGIRNAPNEPVSRRRRSLFFMKPVPHSDAFHLYCLQWPSQPLAVHWQQGPEYVFNHSARYRAWVFRPTPGASESDSAPSEFRVEMADY